MEEVELAAPSTVTPLGREWMLDGTTVTAVHTDGSQFASEDEEYPAEPLNRTLFTTDLGDRTVIDVFTGSAVPSCSWLIVTVGSSSDSEEVAQVTDALQYAGLDLIVGQDVIGDSAELLCPTSSRGGQLDILAGSSRDLIRKIMNSNQLNDGGTPIARAGYTEVVDGNGAVRALGYRGAGGGWAVLIEVDESGGLHANSWAACEY